MKKLMTALVAMAASLSLWAEGYQVNTLSAKQNGMGHTGTALKLGAESMIFNPAGVGFMDKTLDISGSFTAIFPTATATLPDGSKYQTNNDPSTPIGFSTAFSIYDNLKAGITFYTPYGSGINWGDNWAGSVLNQKVKLATYTVQPTIAWRITPKLSVGAGLMLTWGSVDLDKALVSGSSMDLMLKYQGVDYSFGETAPASVNLNGTTKVAFGVNVGAMYDITKQVTVGASFRSKMGMKVESGDAHVRYANAIAQQALQSTLDLINDANFSAEMPCPYVFNVGISYKPIEKLTLAFDAQLTGWSTYKSLDIDFIGDKLDAFDQSLTKNYKDSWTYHLGAQYALTNRTDVRLGLMLDTSPCNTDYYNPETPGMTKLEPSVGFSFRPVNGFSIDLAFLYVAGLGVDGATGQYDDFIMKRLTSQTEYLQNFTADYKVHALIPSIGLSYSF
jgi:long-chain fatty acid transport protein